jgi:hypothetical protein
MERLFYVTHLECTRTTDEALVSDHGLVQAFSVLRAKHMTVVGDTFSSIVARDGKK